MQASGSVKAEFGFRDLFIVLTAFFGRDTDHRSRFSGEHYDTCVD